MENTKNKPLIETELVNIDELLSDSNWKFNCDASAIENKLQTELMQLESEIIHALIESTVQSRLLSAQIDKAILKADDIQSWMTNYANSLDSVSDQVNYIQQQNRPLLIQSVNQSALQKCIESLLSSVTLPSHVEPTLLNESLESVYGVLRVEEAAHLLQASMRAQFDPDFKQMKVVQDQSIQLQALSNAFSKRLLEVVLKVIMPQADAYLSDRSRLSKKNQLKLINHDELETQLAKYRGLMLWLQTVDGKGYLHVVNQYVVNVGRIYRTEIKELLEILRSHYIPKSNVIEEKEYFISSTSSSTGFSSLQTSATLLSKVPGASKVSNLPNMVLTPTKSVFRKELNHSKSMNSSQENFGSTHSLNNEEKLDFSSGFAQALSLLVSVIRREQNYFVALFHLTDQRITVQDPDSNTLHASAYLWHQNLPELEVKNQEQVKQFMTSIFSNLVAELGSLLDVALRDTSISIVLMNCVEKAMQTLPSHQGYLLDLLIGLQVKLKTAWSKFLQSQLRAIQEGRMAKRKNGVFPFIKAVPKFFDYMASSLDSPPKSVQLLLDLAFDSIMKLVLESLDMIADDEELVLENTFFLHLELADCTVSILKPHLQKLDLMSRKYMDNYIQFLMKKSFGKLQDFFNGIDNLLTSQTPEDVNYHIHFNRSSAKKILSQYPSKEVQKCLDYCSKKIQKHLVEPIVMEQVWNQMVQALTALYTKIQHILTLVYKNDASLQVEFTLEEIQNFKWQSK